MNRSKAIWSLYFAGVIVFLMLPLIVVVPVSFVDAQFLSFPPQAYSLRWYQRFFTDPDFVSATLLSLGVGAGATLIAVLAGTSAAIALARYRFPGRRLIIGLVLAPAIVPVIILALGAYFAFARWGLLGNAAALTFVHATLALPFSVSLVTAALEQFDTTLERAARTLGAGPFQSFYYVTLPAIRPAILAAAVFGFFISFDDLVLALFLMGRGIHPAGSHLAGSPLRDRSHRGGRGDLVASDDGNRRRRSGPPVRSSAPACGHACAQDH